MSTCSALIYRDFNLCGRRRSSTTANEQTCTGTAAYDRWCHNYMDLQCLMSHGFPWNSVMSAVVFKSGAATFQKSQLLIIALIACDCTGSVMAIARSVRTSLIRAIDFFTYITASTEWQNMQSLLQTDNTRECMPCELHVHSRSFKETSHVDDPDILAKHADWNTPWLCVSG